MLPAISSTTERAGPGDLLTWSFHHSLGPAEVPLALSITQHWTFPRLHIPTASRVQREPADMERLFQSQRNKEQHFIVYGRGESPACPRSLNSPNFTNIVGLWVYMVFSHPLACKYLTKVTADLPFPAPKAFCHQWVDWYNILCNIMMIEVPVRYIMSKSRRVTIAREQGNESKLLSLPCEFRLLWSSLFQGFEKKEFVKPIPATKCKSLNSSSSRKIPYADDRCNWVHN